MMKWTTELTAKLKQLWPHHGKAEIARLMGLTMGQVVGRARVLNLHSNGNYSRIVLPREALRIHDGRTIFPTLVVKPERGRLFKPGSDSPKLGKVVQKGALYGARLYSLTLEERATCSHDCEEWRTCYGNHMHRAKRFRHGRPLERMIEAELHDLFRRHRVWGVLIRLHVLGDFYSVDYVKLWEKWLEQFPRLFVFGYTAWKIYTPIGAAIHGVRTKHWGRFAIRTSGQHNGLGPGAIVIERAEDAPIGAIVCPAQTGRTASCATCGLCWNQPDRTIAFLRHGKARP